MAPVHGYLSQRQELTEKRADLNALVARRDALHRQITALGRDDVLEMRARALGMVKPGERAFLIRQPDPEPPAEQPGSPTP